MDDRTVKLEHAVMRLFSEQNAEQSALWTDEDRAIMVTPLGSQSPVQSSTAVSPVHATYSSEFLRTPGGTVRDALCSVHGFIVGANGLPRPPTDSSAAFDVRWKRQRRKRVGQRASAPASAANTTALLKLSLAAAIPSSANTFVAESVSHGATWFTVGTILMGLLMLLTIFKMHTSRSLSQRLSTQGIYSLTLSGILAIIAIVEVECLTELCRHEQRYLYNVSVTLTVGISWCLQLLCALMNSTVSNVGREATRGTFRLASPASPPPHRRRK